MNNYSNNSRRNPPYYLTAYGSAVKHGFQGTEEEWLESLVGKCEPPGSADPNVADCTLSNLTDPQAALGNLGARPNRNILLNPFFQVNQRGKDSYAGINIYTFDCWKVSYATTSIDRRDGIGVTVTPTSYESSILQIVEGDYRGKTMTASVLLEVKQTTSFTLVMGYRSGDGIGTYKEAKRAYATLEAGIHLISATGLVGADANKDLTFFRLYHQNIPGTIHTYDVIAAKVELGKHQTLARQTDSSWELLETPDYAAELTKCQRYYFEVNIYETVYANAGSGVASSASTAAIYVNTPVTMADAPEVHYMGSWYLKTSANNAHPVTNITTTTKNNSAPGRYLVYCTSSELIAGTTYYLAANNDATARLNLSAEL